MRQVVFASLTVLLMAFGSSIANANDHCFFSWNCQSGSNDYNNKHKPEISIPEPATLVLLGTVSWASLSLAAVSASHPRQSTRKNATRLHRCSLVCIGRSPRKILRRFEFGRHHEIICAQQVHAGSERGWLAHSTAIAGALRSS